LNGRKELKWQRYIFKNNIGNKVIKSSETIEMKDRYIEKQLRSSKLSELAEIIKINEEHR
jgi:hypothetical protein